LQRRLTHGTAGIERTADSESKSRKLDANGRAQPSTEVVIAMQYSRAGAMTPGYDLPFSGRSANKGKYDFRDIGGFDQTQGKHFSRRFFGEEPLANECRYPSSDQLSQDEP
jgi:hypothetical protein